jgi:hypothetical protein
MALMGRFIDCNVRDATHVQVDGKIKKILYKYGIEEGTGVLLKPSEGGFGVITEDNEVVDMWKANCYYKDVDDAHQVSI